MTATARRWTAAEMEIEPATIVRENDRYIMTVTPGDRFETWYCRECGGAADHDECCSIGLAEADREAETFPNGRP